MVISTLVSLRSLLTSKKILVAYHSPCSDGSLAAAVLSSLPYDMTLVGHVHGKNFREEWRHLDLSTFDLFLFVDVCPDPDLASTLPAVLIVDHHEGMEDALEVMKDMDHVEVVYSETDSGASLAWILAEEDTYTPEWTDARRDACPAVVRIVRARDLWVFDEERDDLHDVKALAEALYGAVATTPEAFAEVYRADQKALVKELRVKAEVTARMLALYCTNLEKKVGKASFKGHTLYRCNCPHFLTSVFGEWLDTHGYSDADFYLLWDKDESTGRYGTSLRKPAASPLDLSVLSKEIADEFGGSGGGHVRAAGVKLNEGCRWEDVIDE